MDKLEMLRLAAMRLDEANEALWFAEQAVIAAQRRRDRLKADYAKALASPAECSDTAASRCSSMST